MFEGAVGRAAEIAAVEREAEMVEGRVATVGEVERAAVAVSVAKRVP